MCYSETVCCGTIFKGPNGEVLIDPRFLKPCQARLAKCKQLSPGASPVHEKTSSVDQSNSKTYSDSSSDSGYDESSNQGAEKDTTISSNSSSSMYKKTEYLVVKSELSTNNSSSSSHLGPIQIVANN